MSADQWEVLDTFLGSVPAEILSGLLEAQGIPVLLSQEGAGHFGYVVTVGPLGEVQMLVPKNFLAQAQEILRQYRAGEFEDTQLVDDEDQTAGDEIGPDDEIPAGT